MADESRIEQVREIVFDSSRPGERVEEGRAGSPPPPPPRNDGKRAGTGGKT
jgi:hypothetical protein